MNHLESESTVEEFNRSHGGDQDCVLVAKLRATGLTTDQIAKAIVAIEDTCPQCWNGNSGCQCWNDE